MKVRAGLLAIVLLSLAGCGVVRNGCVEMKQGVAMLDTHIILYNCAGDTIQTWHTRANVESNGGEAWWVDDDGVQHHICGTFAIHAR